MQNRAILLQCDRPLSPYANRGGGGGGGGGGMCPHCAKVHFLKYLINASYGLENF